MTGRLTSHIQVPRQEVAPGRPPDLRAVQAGHVSRASQLFSEFLAPQTEESENCDGSDRKPQGCGQQDVVFRLKVCLEGHEAPSPESRSFPALSSLHARARGGIYLGVKIVSSQQTLGVSFPGGPPLFMQLQIAACNRNRVADHSTAQTFVKPGDP